MKGNIDSSVHEVALPWSDGTLSARLWHVEKRIVVGVPELGLHCYGDSQAEAVMRLFTNLLKYYRQLKQFKSRLPEKGLHHLELLSKWVSSIEDRLRAPKLSQNVVTLVNKRS